MINILRTIAALAAVAMLAFMPAKASARGCGSDRESAACAAPATPVQLDQFMKTWKPVSASTGVKRTRSARRFHRNHSSSKVASESRRANETKVASETNIEAPSPSAAKEAAPAETVRLAAAAPDKSIETDGVAVTSFNEVNEIDQAAPRVAVVAFNDVNEIDLAAPPPPSPVAAAETVGQAAATSPEPADNSWIGKLLLAAAATIALAGGARLLAV